MSSEDHDPYRLLGVSREASASDIGRAYRRAARATHPDSHPGDSGAADRFSAMTGAYETLRDPRRRAAYDQAHPAVRSAAQPVARSGPRPVWLDAPPVDRAFPAAPFGRRAPLRAGPVHVVPPGRRRPVPPEFPPLDAWPHPGW